MNEKRSTDRTVVIHAFDAPEDIERAARTASALRDAFPSASVRVIVNGAALTAIPQLKSEDLPEGVEFGVCRIGLQRRGIDESSVPHGVDVVPSASVAIVAAQFEGAAYLRL